MGHCEMVCPHFGLQKVRLAHHAIDVDFHDSLWKFFVVQVSSVWILLEKGS